MEQPAWWECLVNAHHRIRIKHFRLTVLVLFDIGQSSLVGMFSTILTYLIILIQFDQEGSFHFPAIPYRKKLKHSCHIQEERGKRVHFPAISNGKKLTLSCHIQ